jgi:imidazolonepropionase-like amidohydrolase
MAASYLGREDLGVLESGRKADFLILEANPLDDIRNTRKIRSVFIGGREVDRAAIRSALGPGR